MVIADNSKLPIAHIGDVVFSPKESNHELALPGVYHIPGMRNNLLSVSQLASAGHHGVFGPNDVKIYEKLETPFVPVLKGHRSQFIYVTSAETAYVERTRKNQTSEL